MNLTSDFYWSYFPLKALLKTPIWVNRPFLTRSKLKLLLKIYNMLFVIECSTVFKKDIRYKVTADSQWSWKHPLSIINGEEVCSLLSETHAAGSKSFYVFVLELTVARKHFPVSLFSSASGGHTGHLTQTTLGACPDKKDHHSRSGSPRDLRMFWCVKWCYCGDNIHRVWVAIHMRPALPNGFLIRVDRFPPLCHPQPRDAFDQE